jgi:hypothetical protein
MARKIYSGVDVVGAKVINLADPSAATDAVNLQYLQAFVRGLRWKEPVRAASTANVTIASPGASIDGVTLAANDRVLLKNQSTGSQNGIYVWNGAAVPMTRALDADSSAEVVGASVLVTEGSTLANKQFNQTTEPVTLDTTALTWVEFGGGGTAYTAGNGLTGSTTFSVLSNGTSIDVSASGVKIADAAGGAGLTVAAGILAVGAGTGILVAADAVSVDTSVVVRKYAAAIGNGSLTTIPVAHSLGTRDITFTIYNATTYEVVDTDATITDTNTLTLVFPTAPTSGQFRVVVHA